MIRPQRFGVYVVPPSKMEPFTGHDQRRLHQGGISGGTNVDVPRLFWQQKPGRVGESRLQSGVFTDWRHTDVSDKSNAALEGECHSD